MISARMLNSGATVNNFYEIGTLEFVAGSTFNIVIQLYDTQNPNMLRYAAIPSDANPAHLAVTFTMPNTDGSDLTLTLTQMPGDASIWTGSVAALQSGVLATGNCQISVIDTGVTAPSTLLGIVEDAIAIKIIGDVIWPFAS